MTEQELKNILNRNYKHYHPHINSTIDPLDDIYKGVFPKMMEYILIEFICDMPTEYPEDIVTFVKFYNEYRDFGFIEFTDNK